MSYLEIELTLISRTAISIGAGGSSNTLADKSIMRDAWQRPLLPGSQLKGKLRHSAAAILRSLGLPCQEHNDDDRSEPNLLRELFGSPQQASPLHFNNLLGLIGTLPERNDDPTYRNDTSQRQSMIRPSVSINRRRGTAEEQRLSFQETTLEGIRFYNRQAIVGDLAAIAAERSQFDDLARASLLWAAILHNQRWGGAKSRGLGWCEPQARFVLDGSLLSEEELASAFTKLTVGQEEG
jgi:CRISPR/Cas system CSM-associated protein Csm3 (group 7 of RAMP superfamily)